MKSMRDMARWLLAAMLMMFGLGVQAALPGEYILGPGDQIRVTVYQNPDLTVETRIGDKGSITYPLIGNVDLSGLTLVDSEKKIAAGLRDGNFLKQPQVSIMLIGVASNMVSVLGQVNKPGRFALMAGSHKLSEIMAQAGGIIPGAGSDFVVVSGVRAGQAFRTEIDFTKVFASTGAQEDMTLENGDTIWVDRAPLVYIYGEVVSPGQKILLRDMTVLQAIATAGGLNQRGTMRGIKVHRKDANNEVKIYEAEQNDKLRPNDIIYIKESLF
jgi:polysaccharide export outer membrane protein